MSLATRAWNKTVELGRVARHQACGAQDVAASRFEVDLFSAMLAHRGFRHRSYGFKMLFFVGGKIAKKKLMKKKT